jgi:hypothetical protein
VPPWKCIASARLIDCGAEYIMHAWIDTITAYFAQPTVKIISVLRSQLI